MKIVIRSQTKLWLKFTLLTKKNRIMKFHLKAFFAIAILLSLEFVNGQNNLLDYSTWTEGSGTVGMFTAMSGNSENTRTSPNNPFGTPAVVWNCIPDGVYIDGGFEASVAITDATKSYRFVVWTKRTGSNGGSGRLGFRSKNISNGSTSLKLDGSPNSTLYFFQGNLPAVDEWYLVVGYIHPQSYTGATSLGGIYAPGSAEKITNTADFRYTSATTQLIHRSFLIDVTDTNITQQFYAPRIDLVDGNEPSLDQLLQVVSGPGTGSGLWSSNDNGVHYNGGNVGIGVDVPTEKLEVDGQIHAREVKVDVSFPAPDYVFYRDYDLKSLEDVQAYIEQHGHLPNIPSAKEIESNGIELGLMNMKLLEKIEELTLYILQQQKEIEALKVLVNKKF